MDLFSPLGRLIQRILCLRVSCIRKSELFAQAAVLILHREPADLELSEAQREIFAGWKRPNDTFGRIEGRDSDDGEVTMSAVENVDLVQDITTDCSVVASLCAGTARAVKGHGRVPSRFPPHLTCLLKLSSF